MFLVFVRNLSCSCLLEICPVHVSNQSMSESSLLIDPVSKEYDLVGANACCKGQRERLVDLDTLYGIIGLNDPDSVIDFTVAITIRAWITKRR